MAKGYPKPKKFHPTNPQKYVGDADNIMSRSSWESKFMRWCDLNKSVIKWNSEEIVIPYFSTADNKMRRYFVDFIVQVRTTEGKIETVLIEIKPEAQTLLPKGGRGKKESTLINEAHTYLVNQDKWAAARKYAEKHGMKFQVLTEYDLGIKQR